MARTLEQKIAALDAKIARLRHQSRKLETGQKIILGGMLLNAARQNSTVRAWLIKEAQKAVMRDVDKKRIAPLLDELSIKPAILGNTKFTHNLLIYNKTFQLDQTAECILLNCRVINLAIKHPTA
jgi:hypothetical protein